MVNWDEEISQRAAEMNSCEHLFLRELGERRENCLCLRVEEARASETTESMDIAGARITDLHRIQSNTASRQFELVWDNYIAYAVTNESFATADAAEIFSGKLFRTYSRSHFLDYVARATIATRDYPGPFQHVGVICLNHVVDVVSTTPPAITRVQPNAATLD
jgi:hypothetical protein